MIIWQPRPLPHAWPRDLWTTTYYRMKEPKWLFFFNFKKVVQTSLMSQFFHRRQLILLLHAIMHFWKSLKNILLLRYDVRKKYTNTRKYVKQGLDTSLWIFTYSTVRNIFVFSNLVLGIPSKEAMNWIGLIKQDSDIHLISPNHHFF